MFYDKDNGNWGSRTPGVIIGLGDTRNFDGGLKHSGLAGGKGCCHAATYWYEIDHWYSSYGAVG